MRADQLFTLEEKSTIYRPSRSSHKGENGRLLVIGGSQLFHASIFWSADVASRIVDLVHFSSPAEENNDLVRSKIKAGFWNGIVAPFSRVDEYINEDDVILIGPGMPRDEGLMEGEKSTRMLVDDLVKKYPHKKWVIDGGALQEIDPALLSQNMIITPHHREWEMLVSKSKTSPAFRSRQEPLGADNNTDNSDQLAMVKEFSTNHQNVTVLLKGHEDIVCRGDDACVIAGGNAGMTKGGTGDVLAGLVASLYCKNDAYLSAKLASLVMKKSGEKLAREVDFYFNASDMVQIVSKTLAQVLRNE